MHISSQAYYMLQKPQTKSSLRLSLPSQQKWKNTPSREPNIQNKSLYSHAKLIKHTSLWDKTPPMDNKNQGFARIPFNVFKQRLAEYLAPNQPNLEGQNRNRYQQIPNVSTPKTQNYKMQLFRSYKRKKNFKFHQMQGQLPQLQKDFNIRQIQIKNRQSNQKDQTMPNIAVKREYLRHFGQNTCFEKALHFRKQQQMAQSQPAALKQQEKRSPKPVKMIMTHSAEDLDKIKVQPWMYEKQGSFERDSSYIQDLE